MRSNNKYVASRIIFDELRNHMSDSSLLCLIRIQNRMQNKHFVVHVLRVHLTISVENAF